MDPLAHRLGGVRDAREVPSVDETGVVGQDVSDGHALGQGRPAVRESGRQVTVEVVRVEGSGVIEALEDVPGLFGSLQDRLRVRDIPVEDVAKQRLPARPTRP